MALCAENRTTTSYNHTAEKPGDIFVELPESDWFNILYPWGTNWNTDEENRAAVQGYVMSLINAHPAYLGRLLHSSRNYASRFDDLARIFDLDKLIECLDRYGDPALPTPEEREAAQHFRQWIVEYRSRQHHSESSDETTE
jgi:hypothetical protein